MVHGAYQKPRVRHDRSIESTSRNIKCDAYKSKGQRSDALIIEYFYSSQLERITDGNIKDRIKRGEGVAEKHQGVTDRRILQVREARYGCPLKEMSDVNTEQKEGLDTGNHNKHRELNREGARPALEDSLCYHSEENVHPTECANRGGKWR